MEQKTSSDAPLDSGTDVVVAKFNGKRYLFIAIACVVLALVWIFWGVYLLEGYMRSNSESWFGRKWYELPSLIEGAWIVISLLPMAIFVVVAWLCLAKVEISNRSLLYQSNLKDLSKARLALQQGLGSLDKIESEYKVKIASFEKLQKQLDDLSAVKDLNVAELQSKLNAIALATRNRVWAGRIAAFVLGIFSSLLSSYLWSMLSKSWPA